MVAVDDTFDRSELSTGQAHDLLSSSSSKTGTATATAASDWTVKIDVDSLSAKTTWIFGFEGPGGVASRTGMTKTAPAVDDDSVEEMNFAVFSCSRWESGFFHAYNIAANLDKLDFWLHLGDYMYEQNVAGMESARTGPEWALDPPNELSTTNEYRARYAQYHTDEALQNLRARAPVIAIWDDHELVNGVFATGSSDHQAATEGNFSVRVNLAARVYLEWMPIREGSFFQDTGLITGIDITQVVQWGSLATMAVLDTRIKSRTERVQNPIDSILAAVAQHPDPATYASAPANESFAAIAAADKAARASGENEMLGDAQLQLLQDTFAQSKADGKPWQMLTSGTVFGHYIFPNILDFPDLVAEDQRVLAELVTGAIFRDATVGEAAKGFVAGSLYDIPVNAEAWDGYVVERQKVLSILEEHASNGVVYSGDSHDAWAFSLFADEEQQRGARVGINICVPSVSAPGLGLGLPPLHELGFGVEGWDLLHELFTSRNPSLEYFNVKDKGFVRVRATRTQHISDYIYATPDLAALAPNRETIQLQPYAAFPKGVAPHACGARFVTTAGQRGSLLRGPCADVSAHTPHPPSTSAAPSGRGVMAGAWGVLAAGVLARVRYWR